MIFIPRNRIGKLCRFFKNFSSCVMAQFSEVSVVFTRSERRCDLITHTVACGDLERKRERCTSVESFCPWLSYTVSYSFVCASNLTCVSILQHLIASSPTLDILDSLAERKGGEVDRTALGFFLHLDYCLVSPPWIYRLSPVPDYYGTQTTLFSH